MTTQTSMDRLIATAEAAFLPLEAHASAEGDRLQLRVLDGAEAVHVADCPLAELEDERRLQDGLDQNRRRLQELGLSAGRRPAEAGLAAVRLGTASPVEAAGLPARRSIAGLPRKKPAEAGSRRLKVRLSRVHPASLF